MSGIPILSGPVASELGPIIGSDKAGRVPWFIDTYTRNNYLT